MNTIENSVTGIEATADVKINGEQWQAMLVSVHHDGDVLTTMDGSRMAVVASKVELTFVAYRLEPQVARDA